MLENDKILTAYHFKYKFSKLPNFKIVGLHQPTDLPTLKAYLTPG